jgi:branched-chain amino acid transport system substrate-binding protein
MNDTSKRLLASGLTRRSVLQGAAGAALLTAPAIRPSWAAGRPLKIGFVSPQTGPIAAFGEADGFVLAGVRAALKDGLKVGGNTHPVQIIAKDSQSNPSRAAEVTSELILGDKVDIVVGSSTADTTNPVADQCEVNGMPCVTTDTPWEAHFFGRKGDPKTGFEWTYHFFWGLEQIGNVYANLWSSIDTNKKVGLLWGNDADGVALSDAKMGLPAIWAKRGFQLVDTGLFNLQTNDFSAQIRRLKDEGVDIVSGVFIPPDFTTFWTQCAQQGFRPKAATIAKALLFPSSVEALGDRGFGLSTEEWWSPHHPFKSGLTGQTAAEYCAAYTKATGRPWTQPMGFKHAVLEVACDVLRRAKNVDSPEAIRDAIAATNYQSIVGPVSWAKGPVKNVSLTPLVGGQWSKGTTSKFELMIANNQTAPEIPAQKKFEPMA